MRRPANRFGARIRLRNEPQESRASSAAFARSNAATARIYTKGTPEVELPGELLDHAARTLKPPSIYNNRNIYLIYCY
jgi:hypothetical protein